jgi:glycosyltransferase involved in cell wall biosynthesis
MRILIVHNRYRQYGGEDTVVKQEQQAYRSLGCTVRLYEESNANLNIFAMMFGIYNIKSALKFKKVIKDFSPHIIHFHNFIFKISPSVLKVIPSDIKVLMTIHNYRFLCPSGTLFYKGKINLDSRSAYGLFKNIIKGVYQNSALKTAFLAIIYRFNIKIGSFNRIDKFIFLTPFALEIHKSWEGNLFNKSVVKSNFLFAEPNIKKKAIKDIDIIYVGRFTEEKGLPSIISKLKFQNRLNIHLVGDGPCYERISTECKELKHITMHGKMERNNVLNLINRSKYLIFPSIWFEGMPMTIIESFSSGVPVIAKNIGAMSSMIISDKTGFLYKTPEDLNLILNQLPHANLQEFADNCFSEYEKKYSLEVGLSNLRKLIVDN